MIDEKVIDELREATNRRFAEIESDPEYQRVLAETRAECERIREQVKARRLARARAAAASRWNGHASTEWTTVRIPRALASEIRRLCPGLPIGKAIQRLYDLQRGAVSSC